MTEIYSLLFTDIFTSNIVFCFNSEIAIASMKVFNLHNKFHIIIISICAYFLAACFNYFFGMTCYKILAPSTQEQPHKNDKIIQFRNGQIIYILLMLSGIPFFGKFIILMAGFIRLNFFKAILISIISKLIYYIYFVMF